MGKDSFVLEVEEIATVNQTLLLDLFFLLWLLFFLFNLNLVTINFPDYRMANQSKNIILQITVIVRVVNFLAFV